MFLTLCLMTLTLTLTLREVVCERGPGDATIGSILDRLRDHFGSDQHIPFMGDKSLGTSGSTSGGSIGNGEENGPQNEIGSTGGPKSKTDKRYLPKSMYLAERLRAREEEQLRKALAYEALLERIKEALLVSMNN